MTRFEFVINLIVMCISFFVAVKLMSDIISKRIVNKRKLVTIISLALSVYSSLGIAFLAIYYYFIELDILIFCVNAFSVFCIYLGISLAIGMFKIRRDETKMIRKIKKDRKEFNKFMSNARNYQSMDNYKDISKEYFVRNNYCMDVTGRIQKNTECMRITGGYTNTNGNIISFEKRRKNNK